MDKYSPDKECIVMSRDEVRALNDLVADIRKGIVMVKKIFGLAIILLFRRTLNHIRFPSSVI